MSEVFIPKWAEKELERPSKFTDEEIANARLLTEQPRPILHLPKKAKKYGKSKSR